MATLVEGSIMEKSVATHLKTYLTWTGQLAPPRSSVKTKVLYVVYQILVAVGVGCYFVYTFGIWGAKKIHYAKYFYFFPISSVEEIMWEFRWLFTGCLGLLTSYAWRAFSFWNDVRLNYDNWKKVRIFIWILQLVLLLLWALSVVCALSQIDFDITNCDNGRGCLLDAVLTFFDRLFVFPFFLSFCVIVYILGTMVQEFSERIQEWPSDNDGEEMEPGEDGARKEFLKIKTLVRSVSTFFQPFLLVYFLLLLCTFFLGICSCFEQMEVRISENVTMVSPFLVPRYARAVNFSSHSSSTVADVMGKQFLYVNHEAHVAESSRNASLKTVDDLLHTEWIKRDMRVMLADMVVKTCESLFLYLVPVWLMTRLRSQLRRVREVIEDSDCKVQKEGYLFTDIAKIKSMCKYVMTISGIKVYDFELPAFGAFILAAFGPFMAVIVHRLLSYIHMNN